MIKMPCDFKLKNLDAYPRSCQHCYFDKVQEHLRTIPLASITMAHGAKLKKKGRVKTWKKKG